MEYELIFRILIVSFPTFVIALCTYVLLLINRKYRKNILKRIFSGILISFIIYNSANLLRYLYEDSFLFWTHVVLTLNSFLLTLYLIFSYAIYKGGEISIRSLGVLVFPFILTFLIWQPGSVISNTVYFLSPGLLIPYFFLGMSACICGPIFYYFSCKKYKEMKYKLKYFFYASLIPLFLFPVLTALNFLGKMRSANTIFQSHIFSIVIFLMIYGYFKKR